MISYGPYSIQAAITKCWVACKQQKCISPVQETKNLRSERQHGWVRALLQDTDFYLYPYMASSLGPLT